jgi:hypothetical protein
MLTFLFMLLTLTFLSASFLQLGFFDPLGLLKDADAARFARLREVEIKHGRISMLAVAGYLVTAAGIRFPGAGDMPAGMKAFPATDKIIIIQMVATALIAEIINRDAFGLAEFPGDYRNGYLDFGWDKFDDKTKLRKRAVELNNGRAAMMGITGLVTHEAMGNSILPGGFLP